MSHNSIYFEIDLKTTKLTPTLRLQLQDDWIREGKAVMDPTLISELSIMFYAEEGKITNMT